MQAFSFSQNALVVMENAVEVFCRCFPTANVIIVSVGVKVLGVSSGLYDGETRFACLKTFMVQFYHFHFLQKFDLSSHWFHLSVSLVPTPLP